MWKNMIINLQQIFNAQYINCSQLKINNKYRFNGKNEF